MLSPAISRLIVPATYLPILAVFGAAFSFGVFVSLAPSILVFSLILVPVILTAAVVMLIASVRFLLQRRLPQAARYAVLLTILVLAPWPLTLAGQYVGWVGHLLIRGPHYEAEIAKLGGRQRLELFDWGSYLIFDDIYLAYDESDRLRLLESEEPPAFRQRVIAQMVDPHWDLNARLWGHFYVICGHG